MICLGCGKEIKDDSAVCMHCGYVYDKEAANAEYVKAKEEYDRQMEEYNKQMQVYRQQMEEYNRQQQNAAATSQVSQGNQQAPQSGAQMSEINQQAPQINRQAPQINQQAPQINRQAPQINQQAPQINRQAPYMPQMGYQAAGNHISNASNAASGRKSNQNKAVLIILFIVAAVIIVSAVILLLVFGGKDNNDKTTEADTEISTEATTEISSEASTEPATNEYNEDYADYTIMVFMIGSNLESGDFYDYFGVYADDGGNATMDLDQMAEADIGDNVNVILETGGTDYWDNDYGMEGNKVQRFELVDHEYQEVDDLGNICMCHENVLEDFLIWGKENYPANNYILVFWDHGCGYTTAAFGYDTNADEEDTLQIYDMAEAMKNSGIHFNLTIFNACIMGSLEMASEISPYCDYMIASEESIYTFGYYYTDWMTELSANPDISIYDLSTIIIDDFEEQYDYYNDWYNRYYGSSYVTDYYTYQLALIDTSKTLDVVDAIAEMFCYADEDLYNLELTKFLEARENCGDFSGTSSVDIIEFCTNYDIEGSEEVIAAVEACILYMKSDISYANGLSFYCPEGSEEGCYYYSYDGRINLEGIAYNEDCIKFYDDVLSAYAGYACSDEIYYLGMDSYYNAELVSAYEDTYIDYADATDFNLDYTYEDGRYILDLGSDFQYVSFMEQRVGYDYMENTAVVLGSDFNVVEWDSDGKVDVTFPDEWLCVDGQIVCYVITDHVTNQDGSVSMSGIIPFCLEEDYSRLYGMVIQWDSNTGVNVRGYTEIDMDNLTFVDGYMYPMYKGMKIEFCYGLVEHEGNQIKEETTTFTILGDVHEYDGYGFSIDYQDIDEFRNLLGSYKDTAKGYSYMKVFDIFGNEYVTDLVPEE